MEDLQAILARSRQRSHYSQDAVAGALGVSRAMVSYWETGSRTPNDRQLSGLARLYGVQLTDLIKGRDVEPSGVDLAAMLLRSVPTVDPEAVPGIRDFVRFLDRYAELSRVIKTPIRGLTQSPFVFRSEFTGKDDIRRKAEEVRAHLGLGTGPIADLDPVCERLGITVYRASLGGDLQRVPSGAFLHHPEVGFAIVVNLDMTPGRRRFTLAHELAHALFHSCETNCVVSHEHNPRERFADAFGGEFLMPGEGVRRFVEESGMTPRIVDAVDVVHIQRYFHVSWATALVRLRQMNAIDDPTFQNLKTSVRPVALAQSLGYLIDPTEHSLGVDTRPARRFPQAFLRMLRDAVITEVVSPSTAASFAGLALPEVLQILARPVPGAEPAPPEQEREFREYEVSGVL